MINFNELTQSKKSPYYYQYNISAIYGIYINNELVYIGSSVHCLERFMQHKYKVLLKEKDRRKWHKDYILLYTELRKAYADNKSITFDIIEKEPNVKKLRKLERQYLEQDKPKLNIKYY